MIDLHKQWASMSSIEGDEPTGSNRLRRKKSRIDTDLDEIQESPKGCYSETSFTVQDGESDRVTLSWAGLYVRVPQGDGGGGGKSGAGALRRAFGGRAAPYKPLDRKRILKNVTGCAKPGRLLAIMGASGSGKTTLLNVLTRRNTKELSIEGVVRVNGRELLSSSEIRRISAYVQQDDLFIGTLKVKEHLEFQAKMRLGNGVTKDERNEIVRKVLTELGLKKCANTLIGVKNQTKGISGGERKRLAFASEILTNPALMFCDEPTSGLDSFMAQQVIAVLKSMSAKGKTIICTIHQPSSQVYKYFDDICLLADGRVAYMGPVENVAELFEKVGHPCPQNFNPADHYIRTLAIEPGRAKECKRKLKRIIESYRETETYKNIEMSANLCWLDDEISLLDEDKTKISKYKADWITQYNALFRRSVLQNIREPLLVNVRLFETILIALLFGLLYYDTKINSKTIQNVNGLLFMFPIQTTFSFTFAVVHVFCEELPIFLREHFSNLYRVDTYYLAKSVSEFPQYVIFPCLFTAIVYFMAGLTPDPSVFFILVALNILTSNVGISLGYVVSTAFVDLNMAMSVIPILIIPFMIFGGFYVNANTVPVYFSWLQYLSFLRYSYEAVAVNQWLTVHDIPGCGNYTCPHNGTDVLLTLHFDPDYFYFNIIILCVMFVVLKFSAFFILLIRSYVQNQ